MLGPGEGAENGQLDGPDLRGRYVMCIQEEEGHTSSSYSEGTIQFYPSDQFIHRLLIERSHRGHCAWRFPVTVVTRLPVTDRRRSAADGAGGGGDRSGALAFPRAGGSGRSARGRCWGRSSVSSFTLSRQNDRRSAQLTLPRERSQGLLKKSHIPGRGPTEISKRGRRKCAKREDVRRAYGSCA